MDPTKIISRLSSWLFICFCATGLLWQLVTIIEEYFRYKVITSTIIFTPDVIEPTALTICFRSLYLLDFIGLKRDLNIFVSNDTDFLTAEKLVNNLTVRQLFDYTPSNNSIVAKVIYKRKDKNRLSDVPKNNLSILKFFRHPNLCYKIQVKNNNESLSYRESSISNYDQFVLFQILFTTSIENAWFISPIVSPVDHIPYQELISTPLIPRRLWTSNGIKKASSDSYSSDHMTWEKTSLPSPYETHCTPYEEQGFYSRDHCINDCIASQVWKSFGKVSLMSVVTEPSDSLQFNTVTLEDKQSYLNFSKILNNCEWNHCKKDNCYERRIFTTTRDSSVNETRRIRWQHKVSFSQLFVKITSRVSLSFIEIVIFVLGSISTWTGLSIMACNPVALARLVYKNVRSTPQTPEINSRITDWAKQHRIFMEKHRTRQRISNRRETAISRTNP